MKRRTFLKSLVGYVAATAVACRLELAKEIPKNKLLSAEPMQEWQSINTRRRIFYDYPVGASPLMVMFSTPTEEDNVILKSFYERHIS